MKVSHHLLLLLIWSRAEQLHWLHCEAHCKWFVPLPTLMMLPLDFWANFEEISSLFMQKWAAAVCRHLSNYREVSFITCMHWVCISSFHVAIKSLLWGSVCSLSSAGSGFIWDTNRKWVQFGMRGQWGVKFERTWASMMHHYSSVTAKKKKKVMCTNNVYLCWHGVFFFFSETVFVFFLLTGDHPFVSC